MVRDQINRFGWSHDIATADLALFAHLLFFLWFFPHWSSKYSPANHRLPYIITMQIVFLIKWPAFLSSGSDLYFLGILLFCYFGSRAVLISFFMVLITAILLLFLLLRCLWVGYFVGYLLLVLNYDFLIFSWQYWARALCRYLSKFVLFCCSILCLQILFCPIFLSQLHLHVFLHLFISLLLYLLSIMFLSFTIYMSMHISLSILFLCMLRMLSYLIFSSKSLFIMLIFFLLIMFIVSLSIIFIMDFMFT